MLAKNKNVFIANFVFDQQFDQHLNKSSILSINQSVKHVEFFDYVVFA